MKYLGYVYQIKTFQSASDSVQLDLAGAMIAWSNGDPNKFLDFIVIF